MSTEGNGGAEVELTYGGGGGSDSYFSDHGATLPGSGFPGQQFYLTTGTTPGNYVYIGGTWEAVPKYNAPPGANTTP